MKLLAQVNIGDTFLGSGSRFQDITSIGGIVSLFLRISFVVAGVIMLFFFILGGIGMIGGAGKNDPKQMEQAKATLTTGILGFVIVIMAYWIVKLLLTVLGIETFI